MKRHIEIYNKGVAKIEKDFDMLNYASYMRDVKNIKRWVNNFKKELMQDKQNDLDCCRFDDAFKSFIYLEDDKHLFVHSHDAIIKPLKESL